MQRLRPVERRRDRDVGPDGVGETPGRIVIHMAAPAGAQDVRMRLVGDKGPSLERPRPLQQRQIRVDVGAAQADGGVILHLADNEHAVAAGGARGRRAAADGILADRRLRQATADIGGARELQALEDAGQLDGLLAAS